jgi:hypothetical protein
VAFTAERLVAGSGDALDVLAHEAFLDRARAEHDRGRSDAARIALGAYALARIVDQYLPAMEPAPEIAGQIGTPLANLRRLLLPRFHAERERLARLEERLDHATRERLWAAGELIERLYASVADDARVPFRGGSFAAELAGLLRALDHWCDEAERARPA